MKKIFCLTVFFMMHHLISAQTNFDQLAQNKNIQSMVISKKMFEMMSKIEVNSNDKETQSYVNLLKKLDVLQLFTTGNAKAIAELQQTANKHSKNNALKSIFQTQNNGQNIQLYVKELANGDRISELLLMINGGIKFNDADHLLLSVKGDFDINDIALLTQKMKLPGTAVLKKAAQQ